MSTQRIGSKRSSKKTDCDFVKRSRNGEQFYIVTDIVRLHDDVLDTLGEFIETICSVNSAKINGEYTMHFASPKETQKMLVAGECYIPLNVVLRTYVATRDPDGNYVRNGLCILSEFDKHEYKADPDKYEKKVTKKIQLPVGREADINDSTVAIYNYKDGKQHGDQLRFIKNTVPLLIEEYFCENGERHGRSSVFIPSGVSCALRVLKHKTFGEAKIIMVRNYTTGILCGTARGKIPYLSSHVSTIVNTSDESFILASIMDCHLTAQRVSHAQNLLFGDEVKRIITQLGEFRHTYFTYNKKGEVDGDITEYWQNGCVKGKISHGMFNSSLFVGLDCQLQLSFDDEGLIQSAMVRNGLQCWNSLIPPQDGEFTFDDMETGQKLESVYKDNLPIKFTIIDRNNCIKKIFTFLSNGSLFQMYQPTTEHYGETITYKKNVEVSREVAFFF